MGARLWQRDYEILLSIARNGFMKVEQIQKKWFPSYWSCIKRLEKLKKDGYLEVTYIERNGSGVYYLTKQGIALVNGYFGTEYKQYSRNSKILHNISCSEFYINIPDKFEILDYELEYYLEDFIPDIYMVYKNGEREIDCLVEIDNLGRVKRFVSKIEKYNNFLNSGKWKKYFEAFPRCIVISNSKTLSKVIEQKSLIPFRVIHFDELKIGGLDKCLE